MGERTLILVNNSLAEVDVHRCPPVVWWLPEKQYILQDGVPVLYSSLVPDGERHTDAFGWLRNFQLSKEEGL